jgi:hypothetical protein
VRDKVCQTCRYYRAAEVPDFCDLSRTTKVKMCLAQPGDPCKIESQLLRCPECGSQYPEGTDCSQCLAARYDAAEWAAEQRRRDRALLDGS